MVKPAQNFDHFNVQELPPWQQTNDVVVFMCIIANATTETVVCSMAHEKVFPFFTVKK